MKVVVGVVVVAADVVVVAVAAVVEVLRRYCSLGPVCNNE